MSEFDDQIDRYHSFPGNMTWKPCRTGTRATATSATVALSDGSIQECHLVIGNHVSYVGIGEILYTLMTYFSRHYSMRVSESFVPDAINVIIDEFSTPARAEYIRRAKIKYPKTRIILLATEFVTPISLVGLTLSNTFNVFDTWEDSRQIAELLAYRLHLKVYPPYMHARYLGFVQALAVADLVLCAHPAIAETMQRLPAGCKGPPCPPLTIYPEIDRDRLANDRRLHRLAAGVVMTGTLTPFRKKIAAKMVGRFRRAGVYTSCFQHITFDQSPGPRFDGQEIYLGYDETEVLDPGSSHTQQVVTKYLYNLNPPQRANWRYSSPMRILRAILLGQIPMVTHKFADHDIESTAVVWDGRVETAENLWVEATMGRTDLVERHLAAVTSYNDAAQKQNAAIDTVLANFE